MCTPDVESCVEFHRLGYRYLSLEIYHQICTFIIIWSLLLFILLRSIPFVSGHNSIRAEVPNILMSLGHLFM